MNKFALWLVISLLGSVELLAQGWTTHGPGVPIATVITDPTDPALLYALTYPELGAPRSSVFKSSTAGQTWEDVADASSGILASGIVSDPFNPNTVYATTTTVAPNQPPSAPSRLYRSTDGGASWILQQVFSADILGLLRMDPVVPDTLYALGIRTPCGSYACSGRVVVYRGAQGGTIWQEGDLGINAPFVSAFAVNNRTLYAGTTAGVFRSLDAGDHWVSASKGLESCSTTVTAMAIRPDDPNVVYAAVHANGFNGTGCMGVFKSVDGGTTWAPTGSGRRFVTSMVIDSVHPDNVYAGAGNDSGFFAPSPGVFASSNGGGSWQDLTGDLPGIPVSVALDPARNLLHVATVNGIFERRLSITPPFLAPRRGEPITLPAR